MAGRRLAALVVVVVAAAAGLLAPAMAEPRVEPGREAHQFVVAVNRARQADGLAPLRADADLNAIAQRWAESMASRGRLSHSRLDSRVGVTWRMLGENVGRGPTATPIQLGFMSSPAHRRNILDARFDRLGVGTARRGGTLYVAQVFLDSSAEAPPIRSAHGSR